MSGLDQSVQRCLKDLAEIDGQLLWLDAAIRRAVFEPDPASLTAVLQVTEADLQVALRQLGLSPTNPVNLDWLRAAILYGKLSEFTAQKRFSSFFQKESQAWQQIETNFKQMSRICENKRAGRIIITKTLF